MRARFFRMIRGLGWVIAAVLVAVSGAGLVVAIDHPAAGPARPELTARGDAAFAAGVPAVRDALSDLASAADALAGAGREAASAVRASDAATTQARLAAGDEALAAAALATQELASSRDALLGRVGGARLGTATSARLGTVQVVLDAAAQLSDAWADVAQTEEPRLTQGLIEIERVRGTLSDATAALD